jgi:hypothetical protein
MQSNPSYGNEPEVYVSAATQNSTEPHFLDTLRYIPQPEESGFGDIGFSSKFLSSLAPDKNFEEPPCQIPASSGYFGIGLCLL